jgi:hypothetical protein
LTALLVLQELRVIPAARVQRVAMGAAFRPTRQHFSRTQQTTQLQVVAMVPKVVMAVTESMVPMPALAPTVVREATAARLVTLSPRQARP